MIGALGPAGSIEGTQYVYYLMSALYVGALLLLLPVEIGARASAGPARAISQVADGLRYVARDTVLRPLLIYNASVGLFWMTYMTLLPGYAKEVLGVGASALGVLLSMGGLGAVVGSLIVASIPGGQRGRVWMLSVTLIGVAMLAFSVNSTYWVALGCAVLIGAGQAGYLSLGSVLLQAYTEDEYRGRALSVYMMQYGLMSLGTLLVSLVANAIARRSPSVLRPSRCSRLPPPSSSHARRSAACADGEEDNVMPPPADLEAPDRQPYDLTIAEAAAALRDGSLSALALAESVLARIEETEPALNAYMLVTAGLAREQAARADEELASGLDRGPLHGIPFALKDLFDTAGIVTTGGSDFLRDRVPEQDAFVVAKLHEAGIALTGKLGMHEFAFGTTATTPTSARSAIRGTRTTRRAAAAAEAGRRRRPGPPSARSAATPAGRSACPPRSAASPG